MRARQALLAMITVVLCSVLTASVQASPRLLPDTSVWPNHAIPYRFEGRVAPRYRRAAWRAMREWEGIGVDFRRARRGPALRIRMRSMRTLGVSHYDSRTGNYSRITLDTSASSYCPLRLVALHEIGHALGIGHLGGYTVMNPSCPSAARHLQAADIRYARRAQHLGRAR